MKVFCHVKEDEQEPTSHEYLHGRGGVGGAALLVVGLHREGVPGPGGEALHLPAGGVGAWHVNQLPENDNL